MDEFVCKKLTEWGLSDCIKRFKDNRIDKESLECLEDQDIDFRLITKVGQRAKFRRRLKVFKEELKSTSQETEEASPDVTSSSNSSYKGKKKLDLEGEFHKKQSLEKKPQPETAKSSSEKMILSDVKNIMRGVCERLHVKDGPKLNGFLKNKICELDIDKRELVCVFGKTGAGKTSLINAIIGEFDLLSSGTVKACTSGMIKVEANMCNSNYEADIEFITEEEWRDELWSLCTIIKNDQEKHEDEDYHEIVDNISVFYGEEWRNKSPENLMDDKYFQEIPEFLHNTKKELTCDSPQALSAEIVKYTTSDSSKRGGREVQRCYWPLVKCVTVRVPNNPLLQNITLVDLPGFGNHNRRRDKMLTGLVGSCSAVWIVTEMNRAASEKEPWEILETACSLIENGCQCQQIHFICTKSDLYENWDDLSADALHCQIITRNITAKEEVQKRFNKLSNLKNIFCDKHLEVFTVSSKEFLRGEQSKPTYLQPDETEIPKLQEFLQNLNDSATLSYVSGACRILSLMEGARCKHMNETKTDVCSHLEETLRHELHSIRESMKKTYEAFQQCLTEGVQKSIDTCEDNLRSVLSPRPKPKRHVYRNLKHIVEKNGTYKLQNGNEINLNVKLSSDLTNSIDEEFRKTFLFRKDGRCEPFSGVISGFSLNTEKLIEQYKDVELQLLFIKDEEEKIKTELNRMIRERKKTVYSSLTKTLEKAMQDGYKKAAEFAGHDRPRPMRETLENHVRDSKSTMFKEAKTVMLDQLKKLMDDITETLEQILHEAIQLSLKTDDLFIPDFSTEFVSVKQYNNELKDSTDEETNWAKHQYTCLYK